MVVGEDRDLDQRTEKHFRPLKFLSKYKYQIGLPLAFGAVYYSYLMFGEGKRIDTEKAKEIFSDWKFWVGAPAILALCFGAALGAVAGTYALRNHLRKRQGKKTVNLGRALKRSIYRGDLPEGEEGLLQALEDFPDSSLVHKGFGSFYFQEGRIVEAMESYYKAILLRDEEFLPKVPLFGTTGYANVVNERIETLEKMLAEGKDDKVLLEIAMNYFLLNDFDKAVDYFEQIEREQDPLSFSILASKFYENAAERFGRPKVRQFSFGDSSFGRLADKTIYFWTKKKHGERALAMKSKKEAVKAVRELLKQPDLEESFDSFGGYGVYTARLGGLVDGFVVLKRGEYEDLTKEAQVAEQFGISVSSGKFKSVRPIIIVDYKKQHYLVMFYENGKPLAQSTDKKLFESAVEFAARSDALMPLGKLSSTEPLSRERFRARVNRTRELPSRIADVIHNNSDFLFAYHDKFPAVFDGDWRADLNVLYDGKGSIIALDKQDKGVTIGPVNAARILYQGTKEEIAKDDNFVQHALGEHYVSVYNDLIGGDKKRKVEPEYFFPVTLTSAIQKAITASCVYLSEPYRQKSVRIFLGNALHAGQKILTDKKIKDFYDGKQLEQCAVLEKVILDDLWALTEL